MADIVIPATLVGLIVREREWDGPDGTAPSSSVELHLEAKKQDWEAAEALQGQPGITVLPDGAGVLLNPAAAVIVLKGAEEKPA